MQVAYSPDPNDAKTLQKIAMHVKASFLSSTPTFLKMILEASGKQKIDSIKYAVVGAEKCPESLFETFKNFINQNFVREHLVVH